MSSTFRKVLFTKPPAMIGPLRSCFQAKLDTTRGRLIRTPVRLDHASGSSKVARHTNTILRRHEQEGYRE